ncbi:hypothetical protein IF188_17405 [Microbacterium sp. NEAU-LLC]|uniref:Uncharacterized protein n=1 Tax=Microbacterium helvum TaxID=2773713 RepID=A0ABR8NSQ7_9MICO|nr:hypothetical protein [Microbacterium helvum]MBD3943472.1 hypothetical protein [Microbacterium helvum]
MIAGTDAAATDAAAQTAAAPLEAASASPRIVSIDITHLVRAALDGMPPGT